MLVVRNYQIKQFVWLCSLSLLVLAELLLWVNPVLAVNYGGIGGRPAYPRSDNPRTESIFIHTLNPGDVQKEGVLVVNNTEEQKKIWIYAVDGMVSSGGAFACRQKTEPKKGVGAWIKLAKSQVVLDPGTNEVVPFTINVPKNADVGEHNGCIVIQEAVEKPKKQKGGVTLSFRSAMRVAVTIPGKITRKLEIVDFKITPRKDGSYLLRPLVKNLGNVSIDADVDVITRYFFGLIHKRHGGQFPVLRGETSDWRFELKRPFWGGWYRSELVVKYDANPEAGIGVKSGKKLTQLKGPTIWFFSPPTPLAVVIEILILLLLAFAGFLLWMWRKRSRWIKESWVEYQVKAGEDINALAKRYGVSWRLLVKANKLAPPYTLKEGQKIKVPPSS